MIEKAYKYSTSDEAVIEKVLEVKELSIAHAVVNPGESFPKHSANANVNIVIVKGKLTAKFDGQEPSFYAKGDILAVPHGTEMDMSNAGDEKLEFFAIKAPSPTYK